MTNSFVAEVTFNFDFLDKGLGIVSPTHFAHEFSTEMLLLYSTDQISLPGCLYFLRYWAICVLLLFIQVATLWILKLTLSF